MTIICDATALILLGKADVLEVFVERNDVVTADVVYEEVVRGKEKGRKDSLLVERLVKENKLKVKTPKKSITRNIEKLFNLKAGELGAVSLTYGTKNIILTDDKKCLNAAKALGIGFITSLDVIIALHRKKIITRQKAMECIDSLEEYGWYAKQLIERYREAIK